jgi:hypothetical protein
MMDSLFQIAIEKLNKNNFQVWKFKIMNFLMGKAIGSLKLVVRKNLLSQNTPHNNKFKSVKLSMKKLGKSCIGFL